MFSKSVYAFPEVLKRTGVDPKELGCVMLPVEPFDIFAEGRDQKLSPEDLYVSDDPKLWWVNGDVTDKAHITLLYGLLTLAYEQKENVDDLLADWEKPEYLSPERVTFFPSPQEEKYAAIVVEVDDPHLREANARLSYLPHINTFPEYRAHMTLAYVKLEKAQLWMDVLSEAQFYIYVKEGDLDYGEKK